MIEPTVNDGVVRLLEFGPPAQLPLAKEVKREIHHLAEFRGSKFRRHHHRHIINVHHRDIPPGGFQESDEASRLREFVVVVHSARDDDVFC